jgi:hypothetical protein
MCSIVNDGVSNCVHMASNVWMVVNNELEMCARKWPTSHKIQYRATVWRYREKQRTNSAKVFGEPGEIRIWLLPNTSQKHYPHDSNFSVLALVNDWVATS